jgi:hypothetical protein
MKRIKHNDLTHYFMTPHEQLPASYLASCEKFFKWLKDCKRTGFKAPSGKHQAPSSPAGLNDATIKK